MNGYPAIAWLLLAITCALACLGLNPRRRRSWCWGRSATRVPMSAVGAGTWILSFAVLTAAAFGILPFLTIFLPVPVLLCVGLYDSWRHARTRKAGTGRG